SQVQDLSGQGHHRYDGLRLHDTRRPPESRLFLGHHVANLYVRQQGNLTSAQFSEPDAPARASRSDASEEISCASLQTHCCPFLGSVAPQLRWVSTSPAFPITSRSPAGASCPTRSSSASSPPSPPTTPTTSSCSIAASSRSWSSTGMVSSSAPGMT